MYLSWLNILMLIFCILIHVVSIGMICTRAKSSAWLDSDDYELQPLLANLGQQGKEFFSQLLENQEKQELEIFEKFDKNSLDFEKLADNNQTQLVSLQRNLLELDCQNHAKQKDLSISINSCHSPLREVQILHDKLWI
ncbi:hypothetical protein ACP8HZ_02660 [Francisella noatunensis]